MNGDSLPVWPSCKCCGCIPHPIRVSPPPSPASLSLLAAGSSPQPGRAACSLPVSLLPPWTLAATSRGRGVGTVMLPAAVGSPWGHRALRDRLSLSPPGMEHPTPEPPTSKHGGVCRDASLQPGPEGLHHCPPGRGKGSPKHLSSTGGGKATVIWLAEMSLHSRGAMWLPVYKPVGLCQLGHIPLWGTVRPAWPGHRLPGRHKR